MRNHFIVRKGQINDLTELQKLFVDTITITCTSDYDKQQIEAWTSSVENKQRWNEIITKQFILVAEDQDKIVGFATLDNGNYFDFLFVLTSTFSNVQWRYRFMGISFGLRYRFGSLLNNVVNTRFGGIGNRDRF